jgi:predicted phage terminase large subunit-like protein
MTELDLIKAEKGRRSLKEFIKLMWPVLEPKPFKDSWHIDCFCDHLTNLGQIRNLLVNVHPNSSKSLVFAVFFPVWQWLQDPSTRLLTASYSLNLSMRDHNRARKLIASDLFQSLYGQRFGMIKQDKQHLENSATGYRETTSVGSVVKGLKGNICLVDDPHDGKAAKSSVERNEAIEWYKSSFYDRLADFSRDCRIVVGQRIAKDDLSGFILETYGEDWCHLNLPYEYTPTTYVSPLGWSDPRIEEGEVLCKDLIPERELRGIRKDKRRWACEWNQNPTDIDASCFNPDTFRYYAEPEAGTYQLGDRVVREQDCIRIMGMDLALSQKSGSDFTVMAVVDIARHGGDIIVRHILRERLGGPRIIPTAVALNEAYHPAYVIIEDVFFQGVIVSQAREAGLPVRGVRPEGADKETRSILLQVRFDSGQVWFPTDKPWTKQLERELMDFPNGTYDDQVDILSYLAIQANRLVRQRREAPEVEKTIEQAKEEEQQLYQKFMWEGVA